jgi:pyruvate/2-oxoglutarate dehydrogenase complex dihydrolipoamide acyltransferase (E2) component
MAVPIHVPRINNNDDEVKLIDLRVAVGDRVAAAQVIAAVETDKAVVDVETPTEGFVLAVMGELASTVRVGSVLLWLGATADEAVPTSSAAATSASGGGAGAPTAKSLALLQEYGLAAADVPCGGDRLSAQDVRRHVTARGLHPAQPRGTATRPASTPPEETGTPRPLQSHERGMLHTVSWQRDVAAAGYIEMALDTAAWDRQAAAFAEQHKLLLNPLLPLMAWQLVELATAMPKLNATIVDEQRLEFDRVNLGFTVQAGEVLYLTVVRDASALGKVGFVNRLVDIQRRAASHKLDAPELQGATIGFSSMARWKVMRHVPLLAPNTALMVAHTVGPDGQGVLGATYDHRVLHGGEVASLLRKLGTAPAVASARDSSNTA